MAKVAVKPQEIVTYTDPSGIDHSAIVATEHGDDVVSLHVFRTGSSGAIWQESVPHANKVKGKKGVASWKKAP